MKLIISFLLALKLIILHWFGKMDGRNMSELVPARPHVKHTHCVGMNRECKLARNSNE